MTGHLQLPFTAQKFWRCITLCFMRFKILTGAIGVHDIIKCLPNLQCTFI